MAALFSDWRKSALCALALLVFTVMFTNQGGIGETAVSNVQELAEKDRALHPDGGAAAEHKPWFAQDESQYQVNAAPSALRAAPGPAGESVSQPAPVGADFPAGLRPPA